VRLPLKLKLSLVITVLVVSTVGLVAAILLRQEQQTLTEEMTRRGRTIAESLAASVRQPLLANDELTLSLVLRDVLEDRDVAYVVVTDQDGRIVGHGDIGQVGRPLERPRALRSTGEGLQVQTYADPRWGRLIDFSVPLSFSKVPIGALYLGFTLKSVEEALARARRQALVITAVMVVVGILGAIALSTVLSRPILRLVEGTRAISGGNFQVSLAVPSSDEIGTLTESFNQMARSLGEKEAIKRAFSVYVAREVANEILKDPEHPMLKGERREVTVLFCDMRGFTALVERLPAKDVLHLLEEFYTVMIDTTLKHDGTLDKFLGDGVMAIFGAPHPVPDHTHRAVQAALDMRAGVREISARRVREGRDPLTIGVGISAGEVVAGTVGTAQRMEYTVVGDSVNLAARLQADAKPGQILISRHTYDQVRGRIEARSLGMVRLRGKELPVEAFEVVGLLAAPEVAG
jgi:adenylate cyclase